MHLIHDQVINHVQHLFPAFIHIRYMASMNITQYYMAGYI